MAEREQMIEIAQKFNLFSNVFMKVVFRDKLACQHVLRIFAGDPELEVAWVKTEYEIAKVISHDSRLDVLAEAVGGRMYNLELQRDGCLDHARRVRFYNAMVDSEVLEKGKIYDEMPELTTYYISETDLWKENQTSYRVEKRLVRTDCSYKEKHSKDGLYSGTGYQDGMYNDSAYEDGVCIVYVNAEVDDRSEMAKLMQYFRTADPYDDSQGELSKRVHFLKCEKEGLKIMCKVTEELVEYGKEIGKEIGIKGIVLRMAGRGKKLGEILEDTGVSLERAETWLREAENSYV